MFSRFKCLHICSSVQANGSDVGRWLSDLVWLYDFHIAFPTASSTDVCLEWASRGGKVLKRKRRLIQGCLFNRLDKIKYVNNIKITYIKSRYWLPNPPKEKKKSNFVVALVDPWGATRSCLRNVSLPERLQSKLGEGTAHGIRVNMWLCKVELKVNLEQSRLELQQRKQLGTNTFQMAKISQSLVLGQTTILRLHN